MISKESDNTTPRRKRRLWLWIPITILFLAAIATAAFFVLSEIGRHQFQPAIVDNEQVNQIENATLYDDSTIRFNGKKYIYNEDVIYFAFLGRRVDDRDTAVGDIHKAGESDTNMLFAINKETGKISIIVIPRDTMTDVDILADDGSRIGLSTMQLCLAYAYGDGKEASCENVCKAMERILFGIKINNYFCLDLRGIAPLNDAIGGVEVTVLESMPHIYLSKGETVTLYGSTAREYVHYRDINSAFSDGSRRKRQAQYARAYASKLYSVLKKDVTKASSLFSLASKYSYTNLDFSKALYLTNLVLQNSDTLTINDEDIYVLPGESTKVAGFTQVRLDSTAVLQTILDVFYQEVE